MGTEFLLMIIAVLRKVSLDKDISECRYCCKQNVAKPVTDFSFLLWPAL